MSRWDALVSGEIKPGLYRLPRGVTAESVRRAVEPEGWRVFEVDGARVSDKPSFLKAAAKAMKFPSYFGQNWDAFEEMVNDLEWVPAKGYLLLMPHGARFVKSGDWPIARSILADAVTNWSAQGVPFYVLVGGASADVPELA